MSDKENKKEFIYILFISVAIDLVIALGEVPFVIQLFGVPIVVDEILEAILSRILSKTKIKLKWYDYVIGALPIPGVTAISVYALRNLLKTS